MKCKKKYSFTWAGYIFLIFLGNCSSMRSQDMRFQEEGKEEGKPPEETEASQTAAPETSVTKLPIASNSSAGFTPSPEVEPTDETRKILTSLNIQIQNLDNKLNVVLQKMEEDRQSRDLTKRTGIVSPAGDHLGTPVSSFGTQDPEDPSTHDEAIQTFRKAMILFQGQKYPEANLAFSTFLERYPDHVLAGSAQYYIGETYFQQSEFKLALQEFQKVLTSYEKSAHVTETLRDMAVAEDQLKQTENAAKHRQTLTSLFPQSPAAQTPPPEKAAPPKISEVLTTPQEFSPTREISAIKELDGPPEKTAQSTGEIETIPVLPTREAALEPMIKTAEQVESERNPTTPPLDKPPTTNTIQNEFQTLPTQ